MTRHKHRTIAPCIALCGRTCPMLGFADGYLCETCFEIIAKLLRCKRIPVAAKPGEQLQGASHLVAAGYWYANHWQTEPRRAAEAAHRLGSDDVTMLAALGEPTP